MKNLLLNYLGKTTGVQKEDIMAGGPVITISRECGCSANRIAIKLSKILSGYSYQSESKKDVEWKWMNKEIIEKAALELEMDQDQVKNVFLGEVKMSLHEVSTAFSTTKVYDADDQKVIDTVRSVIGQFASDGNCIIVGRGASFVIDEVKHKLTIKLQAPLEWRIKRIMQVSNLTYSDARDYVMEIDRERSLFIEHLAGRKQDSSDFDMVFNCATMTDDQIVDVIVCALKNKHIIVTK
jgi:cytidylate kinase